MFLLRRLALAAAALLAPLAARANVPALAAALDTPTLVWTTDGDTAWSAQTLVSQDGVDAATATGLAALDSSAWVETTVAAPGFLTWQWRLDLVEDSGAVLELLVGEDSIARTSLVAAADWTAASALVDGSGPTPVRWRLRRVAEADAPTADTAYLDTVAYSPFGPPVLQTPANVAARGFTARWAAVAQAEAYAVELSTTADFSGSTLAASVSAPATSAPIEGLEPSTTYYYRVVAYGPQFISSVSAPLSLATTSLVRPANDAFAAASTLSGISGSVTATTVEATTEADESSVHLGSVWFKWTAPGPGLWRIQAKVEIGVAAPAVYVYTGSSLPELALITSGAYDPGEDAVLAEFEAQTGTTYRVVLDADPANQAAATLSWTRLAAYTPPANDTFASPATLSGASGSVDTTNLHASAEAGEIASASRSVWFTWKAPASGQWTLQTTGSAIPATVSVWSGTALSSLTLLASHSAVPPSASEVSLAVAKDATYRVSLDGQNGAEGALRLVWNLTVPSLTQTITTPEIADLPLNAPPFFLEGFSSSALPLTYVLLSGPATLEDDLVTLTGQPGTVKLRALQAGDGAYLPAQADFEFVVRTPPSNDRIAAAIRLSAASGALDLDLRYATPEESDPAPAQRSLWFRWTSASTGILVLDTAQSAAPVTLSAFVGPAGDLTPVVSDLRPGVRPRLEVPVSAGSDYYIAVDTLAEPAGLAKLAWSFAAPSLAQTIEFAALPDLGRFAAPFRLEATASSGLPVQFTLISGPATLDGDLVTLTGTPGKVTLRASQPGDFTYQPAPVVLVSFNVLPPPANDNAAAAVRLSGASGSVAGSNLDASSESFDPAPATRSVWWRWTAPFSGLWTVDTAGSAQPVTLTLLEGSSPSALVPLGADLRSGGYGKLTVPVYSGVTYWIVLDSLDDATGALQLSWNLAAPSAAQTILFDQELPDLIVGDSAPVLSPSASSGLPVTVSVVSGPARMVDGALVLTGQPGTVTLRATQTGDVYYLAAAPVTRSFVVADLPAIAITISDLRQTYDGTAKSVNVLTDPAPRLNEVVVTYNGSRTLPVNAGTYAVLVTADKSKASAKLVIDKIPLQVSANNQRKLAGQSNPPLTLSYEGFAPGDDASRLSRAPVATTAAKVASPGGSYAIKVSGGASTNYTFSYVPGILTVDTFAGAYEGLLVGLDGQPAGKLELTVVPSGKAFTGKLTLAREPAPLSLKGALNLDSLVDLADASVSRQGKAGSYTLSINLLLDGRFEANLSTASEGLIANVPGGRRILALAPKEKVSWAGAHTAILAPASSSALLAPAGSGHATATINPKGRLALSGRLADATPFTANLAPDADGGYRLFVAPYPKRTQSFLAGEFALVNHPDTARFPGRRYLPASSGLALAWKKAARSTDKAYPEGFGPLSTTLSIEPWARPAAPLSLALSFGPFDVELGERAVDLPVSGILSTAGVFTLTAPQTTPANLTRFTLVLKPGTGAFTGSFVLSDQVSPPPAKAEKRTVSFSGTLRVPDSLESASGTLLGSGHFLLSPLSDSEATGRLSGEIRIEKP